MVQSSSPDDMASKNGKKERKKIWKDRIPRHVLAASLLAALTSVFV
jgi:hypothetical protein